MDECDAWVIIALPEATVTYTVDNAYAAFAVVGIKLIHDDTDILLSVNVVVVASGVKVIDPVLLPPPFRAKLAVLIVASRSPVSEMFCNVIQFLLGRCPSHTLLGGCSCL